jgi:hypothetical protein
MMVLMALITTFMTTPILNAMGIGTANGKQATHATQG